MNTLIDALKEESNIGRTENGALTFKSTLNKNLDFFSMASAKRNNVDEAVVLFLEALEEDFRLAILNLFYARDIRGGNGERNIFRKCLDRLPKKFLSNPEFIKLIPEYGRWDDIHGLINYPNDDVQRTVSKVIWDQINNDLESEHPSLCAKWFPLANSVKNSERKRIAKKLVSLIMGSNPVDYRRVRKIITEIRKKFNLVETNLTKQEYFRIEYDKVPSRAFMIHKNNFKKKDSDRFNEFIESVRKGETKINASCTYPYEVVNRIMNSHDDVEVLNDLWNAMPKIKTDGNILTVIDTSGSMYSFWEQSSSPINSSIGLGIYTAENNTGAFKNYVISFSANPHFVYLPPKAKIQEKVNIVKQHCEGFNTDIQKVFHLILDAAVKNSVSEEDMPKTVLIISDMEFDNSYGQITGNDETAFRAIEQEYKRAGYKRPNLTFWNVASRGNNVPVRKNENNVTLISGLSPNILQYVCGGMTPEDFMKSVLLSERYHPVLDVIQ